MHSNSSLKNLVRRIPNFRNFWCADFANGFDNPNLANNTPLDGTNGKLLNLGTGGSNMNLFRRDVYSEGHLSNSGTNNFSSTTPPSIITNGVNSLNSKSYIQFTGFQFIIQEATRPSDQNSQYVSRIFNGANGRTFFYLYSRGNYASTSVDWPMNTTSSNSYIGINGSANTFRQSDSSFLFGQPNFQGGGTSANSRFNPSFSFYLQRQASNGTSVNYLLPGVSLNINNTVNSTISSLVNGWLAGSNTFQTNFLIGSGGVAGGVYYSGNASQNMRWYCGGMIERYITDEELQYLISALQLHYQI